MAEAIGILFGIFVVTTFMGFFFPVVGIVVWSIVFLAMAFHFLPAHTNDEPKTLLERMKKYPDRAFIVTFPLVAALGYFLYLASPNYAIFRQDMKDAVERQEEQERKERLQKYAKEALGQ